MSLFERGLEGFHKVKDTKKEAVVLLNIVRLHKIAAQAYIAAMETTNQFSEPQRHHFEEVCRPVSDVSLILYSCYITFWVVSLYLKYLGSMNLFFSVPVKPSQSSFIRGPLIGQ